MTTAIRANDRPFIKSVLDVVYATSNIKAKLSQAMVSQLVVDSVVQMCLQRQQEKLREQLKGSPDFVVAIDELIKEVESILH